MTKNKNDWLKDLKWYVLLHDCNNDKIIRYNIFNNSHVYDFIIKYFKKFVTFEDFVKELDGVLMYSFWSKAEYEILCSGLFEKNVDKIDVYYQLELNVRQIAKYIVDTYNDRPYARKEIETNG